MFKLFIFLSLIFQSNLNAKIVIQNGNFNETYIDAYESEELKIDRYYNSHSFVSGVFGFGWGSLLETKITPINGMFVMVEEIPGGGRTYYFPEKGNNLSTITDKIIEATKKDELPQSDLYYQKLKNTLLSDLTLLIEFAKRYNLQGTIPDNMILRSSTTKEDYIQKVKEGYIRTRMATGTKERFDNDGKITLRQEKNNNITRFAYNRFGKLQEVKDQLGRDIKFFINDKNLVERAVLFNKKTVFYEYDSRGDLIKVKNTDGDTYTYKYDPYHNLTEINYIPIDKSDKPTQTVMKYDPKSDKIVYHKSEEGWETFIEYSDTTTGNDFYESIKVIRKFGKEVHSEVYEIWRRPKGDGTNYVYKTREKKGNKEKTITFTKCCGTPLVVNDNGKVTRYEYDEKGRLKRKVFSTGRIINVRYDEKGRLTYIINNRTPYHFKYNDKNQMVFIGTKDMKFQISYDDRGRQSGFRDNKNRAFRFKYDNQNRLVEMSSKDGSMQINPDAVGEARLNIKGSQDIGWEIRKVYQDYTDLVSIFKLLEIDT